VAKAQCPSQTHFFANDNRIVAVMGAESDMAKAKEPRSLIPEAIAESSRLGAYLGLILEEVGGFSWL
jgi:hypothetical protein